MVTFGFMKAVGIKELKAKVSEYVRLARRGETVLVTDRGEVVAELRPPRRRAEAPEGDLEEILDRLAESGVVTRAGIPKQGWTWHAEGLGLPEETVRSILDEVRSDRTD